MQTWQTSQLAWVYLHESEASEASRVCFDSMSQLLSQLIWFASSCCMSDGYQKGDVTLAGTTFTFPGSFHKESQGLTRFCAAMGSILQRKLKCACFTCFRREDARKYLNKGIFARDGAFPWCLHGLYLSSKRWTFLRTGAFTVDLNIF